MRAKRFTGKTALVTGASGGIGLELAKLLARDGANLIIVARDLQKLTSVAEELQDNYSVKVHTIVIDLSIPGSASELVSHVEQRGLSVEVLINNAGVGTYGNFHETELERQLRVIQLNVNSLVELTGLLVQPMVQRQGGWIMNVASTAAFQPGPLMAVYYATKAFVLHFTEAIASELKSSNIKISALCPGPTTTGFQKAAGIERSGLVRDKVIMDAAEVAKSGYKGMLRGKRVVIPGVKNKFLAFSVRLFPRRVVTSIVRSIQKAR